MKTRSELGALNGDLGKFKSVTQMCNNRESRAEHTPRRKRVLSRAVVTGDTASLAYVSHDLDESPPSK